LTAHQLDSLAFPGKSSGSQLRLTAYQQNWISKWVGLCSLNINEMPTIALGHLQAFSLAASMVSGRSMKYIIAATVVLATLCNVCAGSLETPVVTEDRTTAWSGNDFKNLSYPLPPDDNQTEYVYSMHTRDKRQISPGGTRVHIFTQLLCQLYH